MKRLVVLMALVFFGFKLQAMEKQGSGKKVNSIVSWTKKFTSSINVDALKDVLPRFLLLSMKADVPIGLGDLPDEIQLHILSFIRADTLKDFVQTVCRVSQIDHKTHALLQDEGLIRNLMYAYRKNKSLDDMLRESKELKKFISSQNNNSPLFQIISKEFDLLFASLINELSKTECMITSDKHIGLLV